MLMGKQSRDANRQTVQRQLCFINKPIPVYNRVKKGNTEAKDHEVIRKQSKRGKDRTRDSKNRWMHRGSNAGPSQTAELGRLQMRNHTTRPCTRRILESSASKLDLVSGCCLSVREAQSLFQAGPNVKTHASQYARVQGCVSLA